MTTTKATATKATATKATATKATAPAPAPALAWAQVRSACRAYLDLSVGGAVSAATDKGAAIALIAQAIVGAILEFGFTGNNSRMEKAKTDLAPRKGAGQKLRASALNALEALSSGVKPRGLKALDLGALLAWCLESASVANGVMSPTPTPTPKPVSATTMVAETAPIVAEASPIVAEASPSAADPLDAVMVLVSQLDFEALVELKSRVSSLIESEVTTD